MTLQNIFSNELMLVTIFFTVSTMIGNLRNMATDMGTEVQNQNAQLDRINLKVMIFFLLALIFVSFFKKKDLQFLTQSNLPGGNVLLT